MGGVELSNRIAMSPMATNLATPEGYPTEELVMYYVRRASAGLIITEYTYVNRVDARGTPNQLGLYSDDLIPKFARLTEAIHNAGTKVFVQLVHVGRKTRRDLIWSNTPIAPSNVPLLDPVREMSEDDINRVINDFVKAAIRAERSGFDGIELHGAHGYLIAQFLSPAVNKRNDRYRDGVVFLEELIKEVRNAVSIPIGLRISVTEFDGEGLTPEVVARIIRRVEGLLDYVHLSAGRDGPLGSSMPFYYKRPSFIDEARVVRAVTKLPLFLVGSISTPKDAERVLEVADVVVLGRQLLADPDWPIKVRLSMPIRPCIRCNQSCRLLATREVRCDVNPELGWELLPLPFNGSGEVIVVGGGLMGMETARVLALRGFDVRLYEKSDRLGGQLNEIRDPYKRAELMRLMDYYERELKRLGVKVYLDMEFKDDGDNVIYAVPKERQPEFRDYRGLRILLDSNLYAYQDYVFEWARYNEVYVTENVFRDLDRARAYLLMERYRELGVEFVGSQNSVKADVVINGVYRNQPSIGKTIASGYWLGRTYGRVN